MENAAGENYIGPLCGSCALTGKIYQKGDVWRLFKCSNWCGSGLPGFGPVGACIPTLRRTFLGYGVLFQSGAISSAFVEGTDIQLNIVIYI